MLLLALFSSVSRRWNRSPIAPGIALSGGSLSRLLLNQMRTYLTVQCGSQATRSADTSAMQDSRSPVPAGRKKKCLHARSAGVIVRCGAAMSGIRVGRLPDGVKAGPSNHPGHNRGRRVSQIPACQPIRTQKWRLFQRLWRLNRFWVSKTSQKVEAIISLRWSFPLKSGYRLVHLRARRLGRGDRPDRSSVFLTHALGGADLRRCPGGVSAISGRSEIHVCDRERTKNMTRH
jgi:hypothetical protein